MEMGGEPEAGLRRDNQHLGGIRLGGSGPE